MSALAKAEAFFAAHRTAVLAGGGAGVVGLALVSKHRKQAAAADATAGTSATGSIVGQPADPYSTVAYDVYDALQPQLEQGYNNLEAQIKALEKAQRRRTKPKPVPSPAHHHRHVAKHSPRKVILHQRRKLGGWATANSPTGIVYLR